MFDYVFTEHDCLNHFTELDAYIKPEQCAAGYTNCHKNYKCQVVLSACDFDRHFNFSSESSEEFSSTSRCFEIRWWHIWIHSVLKVMSWKILSEKDTIKPKFSDKLTNNDLGGHPLVHKLSACHILLASPPPTYQSMLENIFFWYFSFI